MTFKDHFSGHAQAYADARPDYPDSLFEYLVAQCTEHDLVWDCATGNGQAAVSLSKSFARVIATDGSAQQIEQAQRRANIEYRQLAAEQPFHAPESCDLVTVAQALHWFDAPVFFENVKQCLKPNGVLAAWCYGVQAINEPIDAVIEKLYEDILGEYWPPERRLVENRYADIEFPFPIVEEREFILQRDWNMEQFCNYVTSWSALQRYMNHKGSNPLDLIRGELSQSWGEEGAQIHSVRWPLIVKTARQH